MKCDPALIVQGDYSLGGGYLAAKQFFALENPPTAIIAANDMSALGVMNAAAEGGVAIPCMLSLVGLDDIAIAAVAPISLTTIAHNRRGMGGSRSDHVDASYQERSSRAWSAHSADFPCCS